MTFPLSIELKTLNDHPVAGATVIVKPYSVNPTDSGTVISTASVTTDANGLATMQLLPSTANTYYVLRINSGLQLNIINPFVFQMPAAATSLNDLFTAAVSSTGRVPEGVMVNFPTEPFSTISYPTFTDTDIPVADNAYQFGGWVDVYHLKNTGTETATYIGVFDLVFDPTWAYDPGDRAEVDLRLRKVDSDGTVLQELEKHNYEYIRNLDVSHAKGSVEATAIAELAPGQYIEADIRGARQMPASARATDRTIQLVGADSSLQVKRETPITPATVRVTTDPATMAGSGSTANPIKPLIPFTQTEKDKLAGVEQNATADQSNLEIRDKIVSLPSSPVDERIPASAIKGLPDSSVHDLDDLTDVSIVGPVDGQVLQYDDSTDQFTNQTPSQGDLNGLSDVAISNPTDGDQLTYDGSNWENRTPHEVVPSLAQITNVLEGAPENKKLRRIALRGETTVSGGTTLPAVGDVPNWTLRVLQDSTADNPGLYLTSAEYDVAISNRNRVVLTVDNSGIFSLNPARGSSTDNYNQFVGTYAARARDGSGNITIAVYNDPNPPTTLYIRGIAGQSGVIAVNRTGPGFINGLTYEVLSATVSASRVANTANTTQTLTFFTDAAGTNAYNFKPATQHHARVWHLQSPVPPDFAITDSRSPAFIRNKPPIVNGIGRLIAVTAALPTTATAFGTSDGIARYAPALTITGAEVTSNYTVANNSILAIHPYPTTQYGWLIRAMAGTTEVCRVVVPLTPTVAYVNTASILADGRVCGHTHMGTSGNLNYFLAFQVHNGNQAQHAGTGHLATDIEVFVAINQATGSVSFPANTRIEVREAVVN